MQYSTAALRGMGAALFLFFTHVHFSRGGSLIPLIVHFEGGDSHQGSKLHLLFMLIVEAARCAVRKNFAVQK